MDPTWYRTFFDGVAVDMWRLAVTPQWTAADIDLAWRDLRLTADSRVLDCPCGHGRHALELARRGCRVTGIDISDYSLDIARHEAAGAGLSIDFRCGDMLHLKRLGRYDAAITLGNSFGYLDHAGTSAFVRSVARSLRPGGRWLIDNGAVAESILPNLKAELNYETGPIHVRISNTYLAEESCLETSFEFRRDERTEIRRNWHFVFTVAEIKRMLSQAGLQTIALYNTSSGEPYQLGSHWLYLVAEKSPL